MRETDKPQFGARLRALREDAGLSQEELAQRAGISTHAVSALERGTRTRPYPHTIRALTEALGAGDAERAALIASVPPRRRAEQPAGDVAGSRRRDLPVPSTPLLGRETELAEVVELLGHARIVSLTGTGGVGKTRLALAIAQQVGGSYADGTCFLALAPFRDADAVLLALADAVDAGPIAEDGAAAAIAERVRDQQLLLVLDNAEHVLDVAPDVATLIESAPDLTVLTTSRAPLRIRGEREYAVEPLRLPRTGEDVLAAPAVRLLLERAGAVAPGWGTRPDDQESLTGIARRVAGVPLALELAAARARLLDPASLLDRLSDAVDAGARDLPERQRTMRATLDWSHDLLSPAEQRLLRLLSVFADGCRLDDLEQVALLAHQSVDTLALLQTLSEHSLVLTDAGPGGPRRYRMLEPVLQYAHARLVGSGEAAAGYAAHLDHYLALAESVAPHYQDGEQVDALARIDAEHPNLTAAAERGLEVGRYTEVARLSWALWMYWWLRGHHSHGRRVAELALAHDLPDDVRPRAELAAATMSFAMDDIPASRAWWESAERHSAHGEVVTQANSVAGVGLAALAAGDLDTARAQFERTVSIAERAGAPGEWTSALNQIWLGTVALVQGDPDLAAEHIGRGLGSARRRGDRLTTYIGLYNLCQVELLRRRHDEARRHLDEGMRLSLETGDLANLAYFLDATAVLEATEETYARVPLLLGAAQGIRELIGAHGYHYYRPDPGALGAAAAGARTRLGPDRYDDALDHGRGLHPDEAVDLARRRRHGPD